MEDLQQQGTSEKKGPTSLEWDLHRQEIIDLYLQKKLDEVRDHMLTKYAFNARYAIIIHSTRQDVQIV